MCNVIDQKILINHVCKTQDPVLVFHCLHVEMAIDSQSNWFDWYKNPWFISSLKGALTMQFRGRGKLHSTPWWIQLQFIHVSGSPKTT